EAGIDPTRSILLTGVPKTKKKLQRIVESLKGLALEIIKAVCMSSPEASSLQYLEALESTFGSSESGGDLYCAVRLLRHCPRESLSDFLRRIEKSLTKVVQRGGLSPANADNARVEELICGAVESDTTLLQLRLRERKEHPPTFLSLLNEVREAEETETQRLTLPQCAVEPEIVPPVLVPEIILERGGREDPMENYPSEVLNLLPEVKEDLTLEGGENDTRNIPTKEPRPAV
ncbi:hypothetical protein M9458_038725, partial [Cirrhinus mrigala]